MEKIIIGISVALIEYTLEMESKRAAEIRKNRGKRSANGMQKEVLNDTDYFSDDELSTSDGRRDSTTNNESFVTTTDDVSDVDETLNELRREERKYCMEIAQSVPSANNLTDKEETCDSANKSKNNKSFMTTADDLSDGIQTQNECDSANQPKNNKSFMTKADDLSDVVETLNELRREERKYCMDTAQPVPPTNNVIEKEETCDSANKSKNNKSFMTTADDLSDGIQTQNECDSANQPKNNKSFMTKADDLSDVVETLNELRREERKYCMDTAQPVPPTNNVIEKEETCDSANKSKNNKSFMTTEKYSMETAQPAPSTKNVTEKEETCDSANQPKNNESFVTTVDDLSDVVETLNQLRKEEEKYCMETAQPAPSTKNVTEKEETCGSVNQPKNNESFVSTVDDLSDVVETLKQLRREERKNFLETAQPAPSTSNLTAGEETCDSANQPKKKESFVTTVDDLSDVVETLKQLRREERKNFKETVQPAPSTNNLTAGEETCDSANQPKKKESFVTTVDDLSDVVETLKQLLREERKNFQETVQPAPSTSNLTAGEETCDSANQPKKKESFVTTVDDLSDVVETLKQLRREERKNFQETVQPAPSTNNLTAGEETCDSANQPKKKESFVTTVDDLSDVVETLKQLRREERKNFQETVQPAPSTNNLTAGEETCDSANQPKNNESFVTTVDDLSDVVETLNQLRREERKNFLETAQAAPSTNKLTEKEETNDPVYETDDNQASVSALDVYNELRNKLLLKQAPNILEEVTDGDQSEKLELLAEIIAREQNSNMSEDIEDKDYIQTQESTSKLSVEVRNEDYIQNKQSISELLVEVADDDQSTLIAFYYLH